MSFSLRNPYSIYYLTAMKTKSFLLCLLLAISANAQIVYHDASAFPLLGKATETTLTRYERLPDSLRNISRKPLWELGRNSAGLAVRFRSNSTPLTVITLYKILLEFFTKSPLMVFRNLLGRVSSVPCCPTVPGMKTGTVGHFETEQ